MRSYTRRSWSEVRELLIYAAVIPDFFKDGEMGMMSESLDPQDYYVYICKCMQNPLLVRAISQKNYNFAKKHFLASAVACRMESIFDKVLNSKR